MSLTGSSSSYIEGLAYKRPEVGVNCYKLAKNVTITLVTYTVPHHVYILGFAHLEHSFDTTKSWLHWGIWFNFKHFCM